MATTTVKFSGPLFNGSAVRQVDRGCTAIRKAEGREGAMRARDSLRDDIVDENTGRAVRSVTWTDRSVVMISGKYSMPVIVPDPHTDVVVTTSLASYGPWLEGTGSRNLTTRFKGYRSFARAAQVLEFFAGTVAREAFKPYSDRMNALWPSTYPP